MTRVEQAAENARKAREKAEELSRLAKERSAQRLAEAARLSAERKLERLAKAQSARQEAAARRAELLSIQVQREADRKRCFPVGMLAYDAGLFARTNAELAAIFAVLGRAQEIPDLAEFLSDILGENDDPGQLTPAAHDEEDADEVPVALNGYSLSSSPVLGS